MSLSSDIRVVEVTPYFLPVTTRIPYRFGTESLTSVTCIRVRMDVADQAGRRAAGWGETPLNVQWAWPSSLPYAERHDTMRTLCLRICDAWRASDDSGHALEVGHRFLEQVLPEVLARLNAGRSEGVPWLAALVCASAFDLALHDAYGECAGLPTYATYGAGHLNADLSQYLRPAEGSRVSFEGRYPVDFMPPRRKERIVAWHAVGGNDLLTDDERTGSEPADGYPVVLTDWIARDGLKCLKIKLTGERDGFDYDRIVRVGSIALEMGLDWLCTDFNCTVTSPDYVNDILDRLLADHPRIFQMILYVEQPFPYDLEAHPIDAHSVSARKPLYMDESAHDWRHLEIGRRRGWTGVALKTCKTQTVAILSLCWARAHGMTVMVQDLTNAMLAQVTHALLCAHVGTVMGLETNGMQFYPDASLPESRVHPGLYRRKDGHLDLSTVQGPGFGYRVGEFARSLPEPAA